MISNKSHAQYPNRHLMLAPLLSTVNDSQNLHNQGSTNAIRNLQRKPLPPQAPFDPCPLSSFNPRRHGRSTDRRSRCARRVKTVEVAHIRNLRQFLNLGYQLGRRGKGCRKRWEGCGEVLICFSNSVSVVQINTEESQMPYLSFFETIMQMQDRICKHESY